jgi:hypothetical protein
MWEAVAAATCFESLAVASRPLQRRLAETNFADLDLASNHRILCFVRLLLSFCAFGGPVLNYCELIRLRLAVRTRFRNEALGGVFPGITRLRLRRRHRGRSDPKRKGSC